MENQDANNDQESSPVQDVNADPSTVETQPAEGTAQKPVEKEVPFHEHPRFQQLLEKSKKADELEQKLQKTEADLQYLRGMVESQKNPSTPEDPYAHVTDPETKKWYQEQDKRMVAIAQKTSSEREDKLRKEFEQEKQILYQQFGKVAANEFIKAHPDLKRDSDEMKAIVRKAQVYTQSGMDYTEALDDAYRTVMFDKKIEKTAEDTRKQTQIKTQQKVQANLETQQVSQQGLPEKQRVSDKIEMGDFDKVIKETGFVWPT